MAGYGHWPSRAAGEVLARVLSAGDLGQRLIPVTLMPLGVLVAAVLCDVGAWVSGAGLLSVAGFYDIAVGLVVSAVALVIVLVDLVTTSGGSGARELVGAVSVAMTAMTIIFTVVWSVRANNHPWGSEWLLLAEFVAVAVGGVGAWFARGVMIGHHLREPAQVWVPASRVREPYPYGQSGGTLTSVS